MISFENKVVWVTGSSSGIGAAIALGFAEHGASVVIHGNTKRLEAERILKQVEEKGTKGILVLGDVTKQSDVQRMVDQITEEFGGIDILVNNAGTMVTRSNIEDLEEETWNRIMDINLNSVFRVTKAIIPVMKKKGSGKIINMTSLAARNGGGGGAVAYAAAKGGVSTLTRGLAKELADSKITVNAIAPGIIATPFHDQYSTPEMRRNMASQVPLKREGQPEEVVGAALYLASEYASYTTGEIIEVNGGLLMD